MRGRIVATGLALTLVAGCGATSAETPVASLPEGPPACDFALTGALMLDGDAQEQMIDRNPATLAAAGRILTQHGTPNVVMEVVASLEEYRINQELVTQLGKNATVAAGVATAVQGSFVFESSHAIPSGQLGIAGFYSRNCPGSNPGAVWIPVAPLWQRLQDYQGAPGSGPPNTTTPTTTTAPVATA